MPSPYDTVRALLVPNYRWVENILVTAAEIFGGYLLAVVIGIAIAPSSPGRASWRWWRCRSSSAST